MKSKQQRRAEAIRSSERHARESMRALGATEAHWRDAELHAINAWPGQAEDFGASPKAMAFVRSMWCEWLREDRNPAMKFAHGVARAAAGYPIDLHLSSSHETAEQESFNAFGSEPFDVQAEARNTLRTSAAWAVIAAIDGFNDIESESVTALVRSSIVAPVCGDDDTAQHVLTARVARFARELRPALNLPDLAGRTLFGRVGPDAASARMPIAARYVLDSLEAEVWPWDAALADALRALGRNGAEAATAILERSRQRMASAREAVPVRMPTLHMQALGFDSPPWDNRGDMLAQWVTADVGGHPLGMPWVSLVAWALWEDIVRPELDRAAEAERALGADRIKRPAGVVRGTMANRIIPAMLTRQRHFEEFDEGTIKDHDGAVLGRIALTTDLTADMVRVKLEAFGTVAGQLALKTMIHRSHDEWLRGGEDARVVEFQGGWQGMCEAIGLPPTSANTQTLQDLAVAGQVVQWSTPHVDAGGFWTWGAKRGSKAAPGHVRFTLGDAMYPGRAAELAEQARKGQLTNGNSIGARKARRIVPELRFNPPTDAVRGNEKGPALIFHRLLLVEMVDEAVQMHTQGGILLTPARRDELGMRAGLPRSVIHKVWDSWQADESEQSPALIKREGDRWTLADAHAPEREFIESGGRIRAAKRKGGQVVARKRWGPGRKPVPGEP